MKNLKNFKRYLKYLLYSVTFLYSFLYIGSCDTLDYQEFIWGSIIFLLLLLLTAITLYRSQNR